MIAAFAASPYVFRERIETRKWPHFLRDCSTMPTRSLPHFRVGEWIETRNTECDHAHIFIEWGRADE